MKSHPQSCTLNDVFQKAEELPIEDVAATICGLKLQQVGGRYQCLCPNPGHNDRHLGSFSINPHNKYWGCFACDLGKHRGNVSLVARICNISFPEAALKIADVYHLISSAELEAFQANKDLYKKKKYAIVQPQMIVSANTKRKNLEHLDQVYRCFIAVSPQMTEERTETLKKERFLDDSDLSGFFILPSKTPTFWKAFREELKNAGLGEDLTAILTGVPGFYQYNSNGGWTFCGSAGDLCLISHSVDGLIRGFQIRRNTENKKDRYISFSSGSIDDKKFHNGCSSGVLIDVMPPIGKKKSSIIAFTEGKFKAITLAKMGIWAINIPGVGNWRYGILSAKGIIEKYGIKNPTFLICYDMDMKEKPEVAKCARSLSDGLTTLGEALTGNAETVFFGEWDEAFGKGIDDVVNNGFINKLEHVKAKTFLKRPFFKKSNKNSKSGL